MYAPVASRFVTYGVPLGPVEQSYVDALWAHPPVREWIDRARQDPERIADYEFEGMTIP
jgi:glutathione S-transferase